jgi:hypothetical protein
MIRAIYILAACCLAALSAGCFTLKDADGKGSRKYIVPALTVVTTRSDDKGEARTTTILPIACVKKSLTAPDGTKTESFAIAILGTAWNKRTEATGYEERELFIAPLLLYYQKELGLTTGAEVVPAGENYRQNFQTVVALAGYHGTRERGIVSSWGYLNLLFDFERSGDYRALKIFHFIPIPLSGKKPAPPSD